MTIVTIANRRPFLILKSIKHVNNFPLGVFNTYLTLKFRSVVISEMRWFGTKPISAECKMFCLGDMYFKSVV